MAEDKLAKFIADDVFNWLRNERRNQLEDQMRRNYDAFRGRYNSQVLKRWKETEGNDWRSKVFVRFTKSKVIAGYASKTALMMQNGSIPWDISPTPIPENMQGVFLPEAEAKARCSRMKRQIDDNLVESRADKAFMTSCLEDTLYGWSWLHCPVLRPKMSIVPKFSVPGMGSLYVPEDIAMQYGRFSLEPIRKLLPMVENPTIWSVFWDMEYADENKGQGIILREKMTPGRFYDLREDPNYDAESIDEILAKYKSLDDEDASSNNTDDSEGPVIEQLSKVKRSIPTYLYYGRAPVRYLNEYQAKPRRGATEEIKGLDSVKDKREVEIVCVVAGDKETDFRVISKPILNPFPYRPLKRAVNQELPGEAGGIGVPEDCEDSQMIINGLTRSMLDNKALASNLLGVANGRMLEPGQNFSLYPGKMFRAHQGVQDVRTALNWYSPPDITGNTPGLIEMFRGFMDEESNISRNQGGQPTVERKTAFEINQLAEASNKIQGMIISNKDNGHIEPMITAFYHYHMLASPDESIKGDYCPKATGYQSFRDKAVRGQVLMQMLQFSISNAFTAQFTKVLPFVREICKTADIDPDNFYPSDDELQNASEMLAKQLPVLPDGTTRGQVDQAAGQGQVTV